MIFQTDFLLPKRSAWKENHQKSYTYFNIQVKCSSKAKVLSVWTHSRAEKEIVGKRKTFEFKNSSALQNFTLGETDI